MKKPLKLDSYHYHEVMDRISVVAEIFHNSVYIHEVVSSETKLRQLCDQAADLLQQCYEEAGKLNFEKYPARVKRDEKRAKRN